MCALAVRLISTDISTFHTDAVISPPKNTHAIPLKIILQEVKWLGTSRQQIEGSTTDSFLGPFQKQTLAFYYVWTTNKCKRS